MSEPDRFPSNAVRDRVPAARGALRPARAERERRVVQGLSGGVSMAEIARREGITVRGLRKYVRTLIARRAPEATGEFIAVQMSRLNETLLVSFGAMSGANLPAVDRVVRIVRELDRYHGFGGAKGTEMRRKLLKSLVSGAEIEPSAVAEEDSSDPLADIDLAACLGDRLSPGQGAGGTGIRRNPLEGLDSGAGRRRSRRALRRAGQARRARTPTQTERCIWTRPPPPSSKPVERRASFDALCGRSPSPALTRKGGKAPAPLLPRAA